MSRVMLVDSSTQVIFLLSQILKSNGYETAGAESGLNALAKIEMFEPDLIIIDVDLQGMSGYDVCKHVKSNPATNKIMVLCMAALDTKEAGMRAVAVGADDFMDKGLDSTVLLSKVKTLVRAKYLSDQLKDKIAELEEQNSQLEIQLEMSRRVQRSVIPDLDFKFNEISITSKYLPAIAIGGDFFDAITLGKNHVGIVMGDVSGHGISAALLTAMLSTMIKSLVKIYINPDQLLFNLNNEFCKIFENASQEMYACVFYAVFDTDNKKICYSNAGQSLPLMVRSKEASALELDATGYPIGLIADSNYEYKEIDYSDGDLLLFHTDGLSDKFYKDNPEGFSTDLKTTLLEARVLDDPADIISFVLDNFYDYNTNSNARFSTDDVSMVLCRICAEKA